MITEDQLEQQCLDWFKELGYQYQNGYDIAPDGDTPERENYQQVTLQARLVSALETLNPNVPSDTLIEVAKTVATPQTPVLIKNNKLFHQYLIEGVPVEYSVMEQEQWVTKHTHVRLIDFDNRENNEFLVVNQFTITGTKVNRRPDVIVFINGLPMAGI
uniref:type I restriction endonuclease n=1 Tax=Vibrio parahaemolyticus TaxID=670 RepID=UPI0018A137CF